MVANRPLQAQLFPATPAFGFSTDETSDKKPEEETKEKQSTRSEHTRPYKKPSFLADEYDHLSLDKVDGQGKPVG